MDCWRSDVTIGELLTFADMTEVPVGASELHSPRCTCPVARDLSPSPLLLTELFTGLTFICLSLTLVRW